MRSELRGGINMFGSRTKTHSSFKKITDKEYTWSSKNKCFAYYDRDLGERVPLKSTDKLIPLTATSSVSGSHQKDKGRSTERYNLIYSNEFTDYQNEVVTVKEYDKEDKTKTIIAQGPYSSVVKGIIGDLPYAKFTKNIYCLLDGEVVKISLSASSLRPWIEFENEMKDKKIYLTDGHYFSVTGYTEVTNGMVNYNSPQFTLGDISEDENQEANRTAAEIEDQIARNKGQLTSLDEDDDQPAQIPTPSNSANDTIDLSEIPF